MLKIGDKAPDFELRDHFGHIFKLSDIKNKANLVIFFYPKDHTPGCTAESCSFRDNYSEFKNMNTEIVGISSDSLDSHKSFARNNNLPFSLLSDPEKHVRRLFGVKNTFGVFPGRATFVIDKQGVVRFALSSQFNSLQHVDKALEIVKTLDRAVII